MLTRWAMLPRHAQSISRTIASRGRASCYGRSRRHVLAETGEHRSHSGVHHSAFSGRSLRRRYRRRQVFSGPTAPVASLAATGSTSREEAARLQADTIAPSPCFHLLLSSRLNTAHRFLIRNRSRLKELAPALMRHPTRSHHRMSQSQSPSQNLLDFGLGL